jgi:hypothetical protein
MPKNLIDKEVMTASYGKVKIKEYDPRFPYYMTIEKNMGDHIKIINDVPAREIVKIL